MVGIVIVSHSHRLAEGIAELAREMAASDLRLETAGGLEGPEHPLGTDAVRVMAAIEAAWSPDGVLVLMDLGSAVLSAEMALDLLPAEQRESVMLCEAPIVEGTVAAAVTASLGGSLADVAREARGGLSGKAAHLGGEPSATTAAPAPAEGQSRTILLSVANPHGLHARPAARLVQTASAFDVVVAVRDVTSGRGPANARSLNEIATLGVLAGHQIEVAAVGPQAAEALVALSALANRNFDDPDEGSAGAPVSPSARPRTVGVLRGLPASPGIALGPVRRFRVPDLVVPPQDPSDVPTERRRLDDALVAAREDIEAQRTAVATRAGAAEAAIFEAHLLFLQDGSLLEPARRAIDQHKSAPEAWTAAVEGVAVSWEALEDAYLRARVEDLRSVGRQVLARILGVAVPRSQMDGEGILVAADLTPADAAGLDPQTTLGIVTAFGGPTAHAAVLARALGIAAVVGAGESMLALSDGTPLAINGATGDIAPNPAPDLVARFTAERSEQHVATALARARAHGPARTRDGVTIEVAANIGGPGDVAAALEAGADGVGLFRTEFLFMDRLPDEDEQVAAYEEAAKRLDGRPMIVRTLDVGADKPLPYLPQAREANPFLGVRGIRLGLARPELLDTQLRAVVRVAATYPLRVMFPMVATVDEFREASAALDRARARATPLPRGALQVGVMIEVPAAAVVADALAPLVDFFSIGTNDLTQYTLAADRGNERVAGLADALHPGVLRLIRATVDAAATEGRWVGICGELAADPFATALLLGLGVRELSMGAQAIPLVKEAVRATELDRARTLAGAALAAGSAGGVRELLRQS